MKLTLKRWPDGRVPKLSGISDNYGECSWTRTLTDQRLLAIVGDLSRVLGASDNRANVFFLVFGALTDQVVLTTHRGRRLCLDTEAWLARNVVADWMLSHAPKTLRRVFGIEVGPDRHEDLVRLLNRYLEWGAETWRPIEDEFHARWADWVARGDRHRDELAEAYFETPNGLLVLLYLMLHGGRAHVEHQLRFPRTLEDVLRTLVGRPTDDDRQDVLITLEEQRRGKAPIGYFVDRRGKRLLVDRRGLTKLVVRALDLRILTKTAPDGTKRRVYVRREVVDGRASAARRVGGSSLDAIESEPLTAEAAREVREMADQIRELRNALRDDPLGRAELLVREAGLTPKDAAEREGLSERAVLGAVRTQRLRDRYDHIWNVRAG